jgi:hypothetical protein
VDHLYWCTLILINSTLITWSYVRDIQPHQISTLYNRFTYVHMGSPTAIQHSSKPAIHSFWNPSLQQSSKTSSKLYGCDLLQEFWHICITHEAHPVLYIHASIHVWYTFSQRYSHFNFGTSSNMNHNGYEPLFRFVVQCEHTSPVTYMKIWFAELRLWQGQQLFALNTLFYPQS